MNTIPNTDPEIQTRIVEFLDNTGTELVTIDRCTQHGPVQELDKELEDLCQKMEKRAAGRLEWTTKSH